MVDAEEKYIRKRQRKANLQSILFYLFRIFPIHKRKIVFCCIEGTTGYSCNPKYIAKECIRRNSLGETAYQLVWLVNDTSKKFPEEIKVVKNSIWSRAYHLTTAAIWIDNSRKQLEVRKRKGQLYIQTWHAKLGFKPTCLDRGASFSKIAHLVSQHDSDMTDYVLSNSEWYDNTLPTGMLYNGPSLCTGSPRCDILINRTDENRNEIRRIYNLPEDAKIIMYAPTFRGGSQGTDRSIQTNENELNYTNLIKALETRFGGMWYIFLRLHPQLVVRNILSNLQNERIIDVSRADDMYEILAGCDAFMTDYSSAAFDAAVMRIPIFIYADDLIEYISERGKLLWDIYSLPFPVATNNEKLLENIEKHNQKKYENMLEEFFEQVKLLEDGHASERVMDLIF